MSSYFSRPAMLLPLRLPLYRSNHQQHARYSSSGNRSNKTNRNPQDEEPEIPAFKISDIVSTRRGRIVFYSAVAVLATMESLTWLNFAPKIFTRQQAEQQ
ncbi:hypothetical protein PG989_013903 [Apiospora arundinis]